MTNKVQECYCWNGTAKKGAFKSFKSINNFLYNFLRENFTKYKKWQYQKYMGEWLKGARGRQRTITYTYPKGRNEDDDDNEEDTDDDNEGSNDSERD